jgi:hypothetical protein
MAEAYRQLLKQAFDYVYGDTYSALGWAQASMALAWADRHLDNHGVRITGEN